MTCKKAQGYLEKNDITADEVQDAGKKKNGPKEALALARSAARVVVARGKKVVAFDMKKDHPDDATLLSHLLGPSRNLRAPTVRQGKTLLVGFTDDLYREYLQAP
jgi:arsenate reductase-like glutaredoxin family protein